MSKLCLRCKTPVPSGRVVSLCIPCIVKAYEASNEVDTKSYRYLKQKEAAGEK